MPPGPPGHFLFGSLQDFSRDALGFYTRCAREYGDIVSFRLASKKLVFINDPVIAGQVLLSGHEKLHRSTSFMKHYMGLLGNGILVSKGAYWRRQRQVSAPPFSPAHMQAYARDIVEITCRHMDSWRENSRLNVTAEMKSLMLRIAVKCFFNIEQTDEVKTVDRAIEQLSLIASKRIRRPVNLPLWLPVPENREYKNQLNKINNLVYGIITQRQASGIQYDDYLSAIINAKYDDGSRMSAEQLRDESVNIFFAGYETTAMALTWVWLLLSQHQSVLTEMENEVGGLPRDRLPEIRDIERLSFTNKVIKESMRLYPAIWILSREADQVFELDNYKIPPGTIITMSPWVMHRDARYYDEPELFNPHRWTGEFEKSLPRFAYLPFGGGPRICIGNRFAMMAVVLAAVTIMQRYKIRIRSKRAVRPYPAIILRPASPVWAEIERRPG